MRSRWAQSGCDGLDFSIRALEYARVEAWKKSFILQNKGNIVGFLHVKYNTKNDDSIENEYSRSKNKKIKHEF